MSEFSGAQLPARGSASVPCKVNPCSFPVAGQWPGSVTVVFATARQFNGPNISGQAVWPDANVRILLNTLDSRHHPHQPFSSTHLDWPDSQHEAYTGTGTFR